MPQQRLKSPFEYTGGNLCLDFANTVNYWADIEHRTDLLPDYPRLLQWAEEGGAISRKTADHLHEMASDAPGNAQSTLRAALQLRDVIYDIFAAIADRRGIPSTSLAALNKAVRRAFEHAQISHGNRHFSWDWVLPERSLDAMTWPIAPCTAGWW